MHLTEGLRHVPHGGVGGAGRQQVDASRGRGSVPSVPLDARSAANLAEGADAVRLGQADEAAGLEIGVRVLEHGSDAELAAATEREYHRRRGQVLLLRHPVEEVRSDARGFVAEPEEAEHLDAGGAKQQVGPHA